MRRAPLLALGAALLIAWCAPMLAVLLWLETEAAEVGIDATTSGLRPAWPLGVSARKITFTRGAATLPLKDLRLLWSPGGWNGEARVGAGRVRLYARSDGSAAVAYVRDLPLDRLQVSAPDLRFSGLATGALRWRGDVFELSGQAHHGSLSAGPEPALGVPFDHADVLASVSPSGRVVLGKVALSGAALVMAVAGTLDPQTGADLRLRIERLEEPLRSGFQLSGVRVDRVPALLTVRGPLGAPSIVPVDVP